MANFFLRPHTRARCNELENRKERWCRFTGSSAFVLSAHNDTQAYTVTASNDCMPTNICVYFQLSVVFRHAVHAYVFMCVCVCMWRISNVFSDATSVRQKYESGEFGIWHEHIQNEVMYIYSLKGILDNLNIPCTLNDLFEYNKWWWHLFNRSFLNAAKHCEYAQEILVSMGPFFLGKFGFYIDSSK